MLSPAHCDPRDCSPPGSSVHGISHVRIQEWFAISFRRGMPFPPDRGIKPTSPVLQADSLLSEPLGRPWCSETLAYETDGLSLSGLKGPRSPNALVQYFIIWICNPTWFGWLFTAHMLISRGKVSVEKNVLLINNASSLGGWWTRVQRPTPKILFSQANF